MKDFEQRLKRLEEINENIREGSVPLEEAIAAFEEGMALAKGLEKDLNKIEKKIEILINQPISQDEEPNLELFSDI